MFFLFSDKNRRNMFGNAIVRYFFQMLDDFTEFRNCKIISEPVVGQVLEEVSPKKDGIMTSESCCESKIEAKSSTISSQKRENEENVTFETKAYEESAKETNIDDDEVTGAVDTIELSNTIATDNDNLPDDTFEEIDTLNVDAAEETNQTVDEVCNSTLETTANEDEVKSNICLLYTSPSPRDS